MATIATDFLRGADLSSRLISWFGQGANGYSHAASVLADGRYLDARSDVLRRVNPNCQVPEYVPAGVHIRDPQSEKWIRRVRATLEVTQAEYDAWEENLRAKITDPYGDGDIWGFILGRDLHKAGRWVCSALAINSVQHIRKVPYPLPIEAHEISPNAALLIVAAAGFKIGPVQYDPPRTQEDIYI